MVIFIVYRYLRDIRLTGGNAMEPICYIVGACQPGELRLAPGRPAFVIAADQGLRYLEEDLE